MSYPNEGDPRPSTLAIQVRFRSCWIEPSDLTMDQDRRKQYWKRNLRLVAGLLTVWFVVSYGCGILFVDQLNQIRMGGFKLGFWFAQQGAIYVFVVLIFYYVWRMNKLDKEFGVEEDDE